MKLLLFTLALIPILTAAQINQDSLRSIWSDQNNDDTTRLKSIDVLINFGLSTTQPDSVFYFASKQLELAREVDSPYYLGRANYNLALGLKSLSRYKEAFKHYEEALEHSKASDDSTGIIRTLNGLGNTYYNQGYYDQALNYYTTNLIYLEAMKIPTDMANTLSNIGIIYAQKGNYPKCLEYWDKSMKIQEEIGDKEGMSNSANNMGLIYERQGNYQKSLEYHHKSLKLRKETNDKSGIAASHVNMGIVYYRTQEYDKSLDHYLKGLKGMKSLGNLYGISMAQNNIGLIHVVNGDYEKAISSHESALATRTKIGDKKGIASSLVNLSEAYFYKKDFSTSLQYSLASLDTAKRINSAEDMRAASQLVFLNYKKLDSVEQGKTSIDQLIELRLKDLRTNFPMLTEEEKEKYFKTMEKDFDFHYSYTVDHPEIKALAEEAYNYILLTKGLLLKSTTAMRQNIMSSNDTVLINNYNSWIALRKQIAQAYARGMNILELEKEAREMEKSLVKKSNAFSEMQKAQSLNWRDIQANLNEGEAAVEIIRFEESEDYREDSTAVGYYAALIIDENSTSPQLKLLFPEKKLIKIIGEFPGNNKSYIEQLYGDKNKINTQLYDLIWKPLEPSLTDIDRIFLSPAGLLHKISFSALVNEQKILLCDAYDLEIKSSTSKLALTSENNISEKSTAMIFGGVDFNSEEENVQVWSYLEGTKKEAESIARIWDKKNQEVLLFTGRDAQESSFKKYANTADVIHISTHGFFYANPEEIDQKAKEEAKMSGDIAFRGGGRTGFGYQTFVHNPNSLMRSGVVLAGANQVWSNDKVEGEDGVLTAQEVATLDLRNTDLVVLSACETGLGEIKRYEGVYGLQRSFKMAGANFLIMSLWQVPDKETAEFMELFYSQLKKTNDVKKSFRTAQLKMSQKHDPYYWAAFVLIE